MGSEYKHVGQLRPKKGHKTYKVDRETLEIYEAKLSTLPIKNSDGKAVFKKKIIIEDGFFYLSALNVKNVKRKLVNVAKVNKKE